MLPFDPELQAMSDEELRELWDQCPSSLQTAIEMDWIRVAKELRHRERHRSDRRGPTRSSFRLSARR